MKNKILSALLLGLSVLPLGCGSSSTSSNISASKTSQAAETTPQVLKGTGFDGKPCTLTLERGSDGKLKKIEFTEDFKVDYKLPAPGSGLYGVYYWPTTFRTDVHLAAAPWTVKRSLLRDADVVEGEGKALFWDDVRHHKLVFKPSIEAPKSVTYSSIERILGAVPFVVLDGLCTF